MDDPIQAEHLPVSRAGKMTPLSSQADGLWFGVSSTSIVPPEDYWSYLADLVPESQLGQLKQLKVQSDKRVGEFNPSGLPPPENTAVDLLEHVTDDGWLERIQRHRCPNCDFELTEEEASQPSCPNCGEAYSHHGSVTVETVYIRDLAPSRDVDWVVAIHGMNTTGSWQEAFSWYLGTTWGRSVPVAVYKYGIVIAGVIMAWRRRKLLSDLRDKLAVLRKEADSRGYTGKPDVIAHSFGTWLIGHLLKKEFRRNQEEQLKFGRIILTGCILRPDFDWKSIKDAELIDDVINHYGSKDSIVPFAHLMIWDSGPSGRHGFDSDQVFNLRAEGCGHTDLFSINKYVVNGEYNQGCTNSNNNMSHLEHFYKRCWRPFLTIPRHELDRFLDRSDPTTTWCQLPWPLRGTVIPFLALLLILALIALLVAGIGRGLWGVWKVPVIVASISAAGLLLMLATIPITALWRRIRKWVRYR